MKHMRHITLLVIFILSICISGVTWAAKSSEERFTNTIVSARENYENALEELIQYCMDTGNRLGQENARKALKALKKVPRFGYPLASRETTNISASRNIEAANVLFQDGMEYKNPLNIIKRKEKLESAVARFEKILVDYPESDIADDAAYELATIYDTFFSKDYEAALFYYVRCFSLNPYTDKPAHFKAARIYDNLKDYSKAVINYRVVMQNSMDEGHRSRAKARLKQLRKKGY